MTSISKFARNDNNRPENRPLSAVAHEPVLGEAELTRRNQLLPATHKSLSLQAQVVARCADCILSRFTDDGAEVPLEAVSPPGIVLSYIPPCTGQPRSTAVSTFYILRQTGLVAARQFPRDSLAAQLYGSANLPLLLVPLSNNDGQQFFRPQRRPGCERTIQDSIVDSLAPYPRTVLEHVVRLTLAEEPITKTGFDGKIQPPALNHALQLFMRTDILAQDRRQYRLTERGLWLAEGLGTKSSEVPSAKRGSSVTESSGVVDRWIIEHVQKFYPRESHTVIKALRRLILNNVLEISDIDQSANPKPRKPVPGMCNYITNERLGFSERTIAHTTPLQREAIAVWQRIDRLLYQKNLDPRRILEGMRLRTGTSIDEYTAKVIYRRLVEQLGKEG
jgi:hypothetical protein